MYAVNFSTAGIQRVNREGAHGPDGSSYSAMNCPKPVQPVHSWCEWKIINSRTSERAQNMSRKRNEDKAGSDSTEPF